MIRSSSRRPRPVSRERPRPDRDAHPERQVASRRRRPAAGSSAATCTATQAGDVVVRARTRRRWRAALAAMARARHREGGPPGARAGRPDQVLRRGGRRHSGNGGREGAGRVVPVVLPPGPEPGGSSVRPAGARLRRLARRRVAGSRGLRRRRDRDARRAPRRHRLQRLAELRPLPRHRVGADRLVPGGAVPQDTSRSECQNDGRRARMRRKGTPSGRGRGRSSATRSATWRRDSNPSRSIRASRWPAAGAAASIDEDGNGYIDFIAGIAVGSVGHCHPHYVARLKEQLERLTFGSFTTEVAGEVPGASRERHAAGSDAHPALLRRRRGGRGRVPARQVRDEETRVRRLHGRLPRQDGRRAAAALGRLQARPRALRARAATPRPTPTATAARSP